MFFFFFSLCWFLTAEPEALPGEIVKPGQERSLTGSFIYGNLQHWLDNCPWTDSTHQAQMDNSIGRIWLSKRTENGTRILEYDINMNMKLTLAVTQEIDLDALLFLTGRLLHLAGVVIGTTVWGTHWVETDVGTVDVADAPAEPEGISQDNYYHKNKLLFIIIIIQCKNAKYCENLIKHWAWLEESQNI